MFNKTVSLTVAALTAAIFLSSCAFTRTSSETTQNTSDASTDLTSSTSKRDDDKEEVEVVVEEFVQSNFDQLRSDMAVGEGEYLASLASLLSIDDADKQQFYSLTKNNFNKLFVSPETTPQELVKNLNKEVAQAQI
ncbi:MAG: hypothetical protein DRQ54_10800 [Gammaproteobacteria bacterium]|nr:MAG: hypothetical protein DRQ54_10800 [Gammaproteobacteria bacterium]RLA15541.1 MAG: hypothetical protein DRQ52_01640 [Gammaproteobacteria bacterium]